MNHKIKRRWVNALRSGYYIQGISDLYADGKYCALGVLAHIEGVSTDCNAEDQAHNVYRWLRVTVGIDLHGIYHMNDSAMLDFNQIADWIEEKL